MGRVYPGSHELSWIYFSELKYIESKQGSTTAAVVTLAPPPPPAHSRRRRSEHAPGTVPTPIAGAAALATANGEPLLAYSGSYFPPP